MQGRRRADDTLLEEVGEPGDYVLRPNRRDLWMVLPTGALCHIYVNEGSPEGGRTWGFAEHEDGSITVTPSIWLRGGDPAENAEWHGFLERGTFRSC